ncbi:MAG TPA: efflux RND transporter periplasmic adaptor subunit [Candidatus Acidoferrales bacterium]|nr:efflux RND transporter periplasmic adaptor subunit [Candidatus Acidoferrales bacterium]
MNEIAQHRLRSSLATVMAIFIAGCTSDGTSHTSATPSAPAVPVTVAAVQQRDVPVRIRAIGAVEAYSTVAVTPQVDGQLAQVHFQEGQWVKKDDLLFTIDPRPFEAALKQAQANLTRHQAEASNAMVEAKRKGRLLADGFVSADENDQAQTNAAALQAEVNADNAAVETAKLQLQFCSIRSPLDGRVGQLLIHEGNVVKKNETRLAVINQVQPIYVAFSVREQDLPEIRKHSAGTDLAVEAVPSKSSGEPAVGKLRFINNAVDAATGTVLLKAEFGNDDERLWPGQFADVQLTLTTEHDAVILPTGAVLKGQQGVYVFVVKPDDTVETRNIVVGMDLGPEVTVREGVKPGDRVVVDGQIRLAPGFKVEIKNATASS